VIDCRKAKWADIVAVTADSVLNSVSSAAVTDPPRRPRISSTA
jgi:hypothetical protein